MSDSTNSLHTYKHRVIWNEPVICCPHIPEVFMNKINDLPYLEKKEEKEVIKEMIYGSGETLSEKQKKLKEDSHQLITE